MGYDNTIPELIAGALHDAQEMIRQEIAIARTEIREEANRLKSGVAALAGAAVAGLLALVFLLTTIAWGVAEGMSWPTWTGFAFVTFIVGVVAVILAVVGRARLATSQRMPKTVESLKENAEWLKARTQH
jgi:hypothetical protein